MDELVISDRRYISTRRAGKEHGYHSDYIGQLIRGGKVQGQKVGRSWYVDAESLATHLGKEYSASVGPAAATPEVAKVIEPEVAETRVQEAVAEDIPVETPAEILPPVEEVVAEVNKKPVVEDIPVQKEKVVLNEIKQIEKAEVAEEQRIPIRKPVAATEVPVQEVVEEEPVVVPITRVMPHKQIEEPRTYGLRYMVDEEPLLPEIQPAINESRHTDTPATAIKQGNLRSAKTSRPVAGMIITAGVGLVAIALGAAASAFVSSTVSVVDGQTASISYSFGQ